MSFNYNVRFSLYNVTAIALPGWLMHVLFILVLSEGAHKLDGRLCGTGRGTRGHQALMEHLPRYRSENNDPFHCKPSIPVLVRLNVGHFPRDE
ncbi:uncharacterized protein BO97DRAFT_268756 [Aspergillus homomorphus CBS 101889]|uniref:Uncharacterized protein n=1 Tax=Aspergillus homomorphus (strain CBS 101889) TaxID=1450537 RepID=A0A395HIL4_ASPHC|nr:hypothetical protein BO97DRAFT_268756 [Aspergillus homomorphus CBS 101889]RAL07015.1 hypothetical protein BO97DRAFT_268756 [Aspergillus homomorphus CBS 101889]